MFWYFPFHFNNFSPNRKKIRATLWNMYNVTRHTRSNLSDAFSGYHAQSIFVAMCEFRQDLIYLHLPY